MSTAPDSPARPARRDGSCRLCLARANARLARLDREPRAPDRAHTIDDLDTDADRDEQARPP